MPNGKNNNTFTSQHHAYWGGHTNPEITKEIIRAIPKTDLHCRLGIHSVHIANTHEGI